MVAGVMQFREAVELLLLYIKQLHVCCTTKEQREDNWTTRYARTYVIYPITTNGLNSKLNKLVRYSLVTPLIIYAGDPRSSVTYLFVSSRGHHTYSNHKNFPKYYSTRRPIINDLADGHQHYLILASLKLLLGFTEGITRSSSNSKLCAYI